MKTPNNRIKEVLNEKGIKQTWLAEQLGKSFAMVNAYVGNHRQPSLDMIAQIADILKPLQNSCYNLPFSNILCTFIV